MTGNQFRQVWSGYILTFVKDFKKTDFHFIQDSVQRFNCIFNNDIKKQMNCSNSKYLLIEMLHNKRVYTLTTATVVS